MKIFNKIYILFYFFQCFKMVYAADGDTASVITNVASTYKVSDRHLFDSAGNFIGHREDPVVPVQNSSIIGDNRRPSQNSLVKDDHTFNPETGNFEPDNTQQGHDDGKALQLGLNGNGLQVVDAKNSASQTSKDSRTFMQKAGDALYAVHDAIRGKNISGELLTHNSFIDRTKAAYADRGVVRSVGDLISIYDDIEKKNKARLDDIKLQGEKFEVNTAQLSGAASVRYLISIPQDQFRRIHVSQFDSILQYMNNEQRSELLKYVLDMHLNDQGNVTRENAEQWRIKKIKLLEKIIESLSVVEGGNTLDFKDSNNSMKPWPPYDDKLVSRAEQAIKNLKSMEKYYTIQRDDRLFIKSVLSETLIDDLSGDLRGADALATFL